MAEKIFYLWDLDLTKAEAYYGDVAGTLYETIESLRQDPAQAASYPPVTRTNPRITLSAHRRH